MIDITRPEVFVALNNPKVLGFGFGYFFSEEQEHSG